MNTPQAATATRWNRWAAFIGVAATLALVLWIAGWTGDSQMHRGLDALLVLIRALPYVLAWLAAAWGFGWLMRRALLRSSSNVLSMQVVLGVATLLVLDAALGRLGLLQWQGAFGAWLVLAAGWALLLVQLIIEGRGHDLRPVAPHWLVWLAAPSIAALLVAACSAPGWLWSSEFGGYDALSYHLQLPKEWLALGRIEPLEHNVYGFLPGYVEAAYYHLAVVIGDGIEAVYACQLLHAGFALLTAALLGRFVQRIAPQSVAWLSAALAVVAFLGTPWVIVVGSLAYNEMATLLMLAGGLLLIAQPGDWRTGRGAALGLLAGAACGAKLTALGFVALPLLVVALTIGRPRARLVDLAVGLAVGTAALLPWLIGNWIAAGNPLFPFATGMLGTGHWTAEQVETFAAAHRPSGSLIARLIELWNQWLRHGLGPNPDASGFERWSPQWSLLPWLALAGGAVAVVRSATRRWALGLLVVLALQLTFWLLCTHLKSRFLLPAAVPCAALVSLGVVAILNRATISRGWMALLALMALAWCCVPIWLFRREHDSAPSLAIGTAALLAGDGMTAEQMEEAARNGLIAVFVNHLLPADAKVQMIGDATPLYCRADARYQTTWDRGPLSKAMRDHPDQPQAWATALCRQGFTHVLVDPGMLWRWQQSGWNDPLLTAERVQDFVEGQCELVQRFPSGATVYRLRCE